jgi:hypothetical protein
MIEGMAIVHMTEAEVVKDIAAVLAKVRQGPSKPEGRMITEVIADLRARGSKAVIDDDFASDIEEGLRHTGSA